MDPILDTIENALIRSGMSAAAASIRASGNASLIKNIRNGGGNAGFDTLQKLADVLGLECYFGPPRDTGPVETIPADDPNFAHIPLHEALLSAGPGIENGYAEVTQHLAFRQDWLRKIGVAPSNACLAHVCGDSMQPTIFAGDMILIDTSKRELAPRKAGVNPTLKRPIYALIQDGQARVKRLDRPSDDMLVLISDNPDNPPEFLTGADARQVQIIGKVLWWGHTVRD